MKVSPKSRSVNVPAGTVKLKLLSSITARSDSAAKTLGVSLTPVILTVYVWLAVAPLPSVTTKPKVSEALSFNASTALSRATYL